VNVVGELQPKRTLAASRGFLAAARLSCIYLSYAPLSTSASQNSDFRYVDKLLHITIKVRKNTLQLFLQRDAL